MLERFCDVKDYFEEENVGLKNAFGLPVLSFLREIYSSKTICELIENFSEKTSKEIIKELGLTQEELADIYRKFIYEGIRAGTSEMNILALDSFVLSKIYKEFGLHGEIIIRAKDLKENSEVKNIFIDPYFDSDNEINATLKEIAKGATCYIRLFDDLEKTGELNSEYKMLPIEYVEKAGLLDRKFCIIGGMCADKEDFSIISSYGGKMVICPHDQCDLGKGFINVIAMQNSGLEIELASPIHNNISDEAHLLSVITKGLLNDPDIITIDDCYDMTRGKGKINLNNYDYNALKERCEIIKKN